MKKKKVSINITIRINGSVTSVSLKKNLVALWLLLNGGYKKWRMVIVDFVYCCLDEWEGESAKGFSDFVSDKMFEDFLEASDVLLYKKIVRKLDNF